MNDGMKILQTQFPVLNEIDPHVSVGQTFLSVLLFLGEKAGNGNVIWGQGREFIVFMRG